MKILEEFYYGNIPQINLEIPQSNRYQRALKLMNQNSERLTAHFDDKQRELFEKMNDCQSEMTDEVKKEYISPRVYSRRQIYTGSEG